MASENLYSFILRPCDLSLLPAAGSPTTRVLDEQMAGSNLALVRLCAIIMICWTAVVFGHVGLQLLHVRVRWRLPSRFFGFSIEVVGEVFRVRVPDYPACRETCVRLYRGSVRLVSTLTLRRCGALRLSGKQWRWVGVP